MRKQYLQGTVRRRKEHENMEVSIRSFVNYFIFYCSTAVLCRRHGKCNGSKWRIIWFCWNFGWNTDAGRWNCVNSIQKCNREWWKYSDFDSFWTGRTYRIGRTWKLQ